MATQAPTPITLTASVSPALADVEYIMSSMRLTAPYRRPMLLREIRFRVVFTGTNALSPNNCYGQNGDTVEANLKMGRLELTRGFVPVWLFGPAGCPDAETPGSRVSAGMFAGSSVYKSLADPRVNNYRWILPKPLFVPPGANIQCRIRVGRATAARTFKVDVAYAGLLLPPTTKTPNEMAVPFATVFTDRPADAEAYASNEVATSRETELANSTQGVLNCQRLTGRVAQQISSLNFDFIGLNNAVSDLPLTIEMRSSTGYTVMLPGTPFNVAFSPYRETRFSGTIGQNERMWLRICAGENIRLTGVQVGLIAWRSEAAEAM